MTSASCLQPLVLFLIYPGSRRRHRQIPRDLLQLLQGSAEVFGDFFGRLVGWREVG